jgi:hypothetical protein
MVTLILQKNRYNNNKKFNQLSYVSALIFFWHPILVLMLGILCYMGKSDALFSDSLGEEC